MFKKYTLSILLVLVLAVSMFTATAVIASAEDAAPVDNEVVSIVDGEEYADTGINEVIDPTEEVTEPEEATEAEETVPETEAETEIATEAPTEAETQVATADETVAPTTAPKNNTPKTGDNYWLYIGIGIAAVAVIAIIISVVVSKKKNAK